MKLARALADHVRPMMIVFPVGLLGIGPALTLLFVAFGLALITSWLAGEFVAALEWKDPNAGVDGTGALDGGPTRW